MKRTVRVVLLMCPFAEYDRELISGIGRYARLHGTWVFQVPGDYPGLPVPQTEAVNLPIENIARAVGGRSRGRLLNFKEWGVTGVIGRLQTPAIAEQVLSCNVPVIAMDRSALQLADESPLSKISEIHPDSIRIGRLAAEHLLECGLNRFAFCGYAGRIWSQQREDGFVERLQEACFSCEVYEPPSHRSRLHWDRELPLIQKWLQSLPKPVGVMAANDVRGRQLLEACFLSGIRVPDDVAVIGSDNDGLLCDMANPPLSSVALNAEQAGYRAAELLDAMMSGKVKKRQQILVEPIRVVARQSTDVVAVEDRDVADALRFIRENARWAIGVEDVVDSVKGVSRRSLEIRFQQAVGRPIRKEIQRVRLTLVKQLLLETALPLPKIAEVAGFNDLSYLSKVFRQEEGTTLLKFRKFWGQ